MPLDCTRDNDIHVIYYPDCTHTARGVFIAIQMVQRLPGQSGVIAEPPYYLLCLLGNCESWNAGTRNGSKLQSAPEIR